MSQRMSQKESKTFLYKKVYQDLKDRIQNGEYLRDALLPSEREIGETYQVDRTTVRKALQLLVDDGLVEKRAGKGTVVVWRPDQEQTQSRPVLRRSGGTAPLPSFFQEGITTVPALPSPFIPSCSTVRKRNARSWGIPWFTPPWTRRIISTNWCRPMDFSGIFFVSNVCPPPSGPGPGVKDSFHTDKQLL